jgi:hypothetical protein
LSFQTGTATDYSDLLDQLDTFLTSQGMTLSPSYAGTGNGTIAGLIGGSASVAETFTIAFTSATAFTVTGSITGALAGGTVGVAYSTTHINFTITAGGTAFIAGDTFTIATTPPWTSKRRTSGDQMIWQGPGNGNVDQILVGAKLFHDAGADYYNWRLAGYTAFSSGLDFEHQPGYLGGTGQQFPSPVLNLWNSTIPYWFIGNGRRVIVVAKISTVYVSCYLGFINPYMSPGAYPYPLAVGGSMAWDSSSISGEPAANSTNWRWSFVGSQLRNFPESKAQALGNDAGGQMRLRLPTGVWRGFTANNNDTLFGRLWPTGEGHSGGMTDWRPNLDGGYSILPIVLYDSSLINVYGELDGVGCVTGHGQSAENTITIGSDVWLVIQDVNRTTKIDYFAVKLT